jgi:predicted ArsR family transcriptional regulator
MGQDVLDAMLGAGARGVRSGPQLTRVQREVLEALKDGAQSVEEIASDTDLPREEARRGLESLTALGYVDVHSTFRYSPSGLEAPED